MSTGAGSPGSQEAYDEAYDRLWTALDWLEDRLTDRRFLMGDEITEADVRLFTTLVRFDAVYHSHFKCNRNKLTEMPALWGYARDLFQHDGFHSTVDFDQIKRHYYVVQSDLNPSGIVPQGPDLDGWVEPARPRLTRGSRRLGVRAPRCARASDPVQRRRRGRRHPHLGALDGDPRRQVRAPERVLGPLVEGVVPELRQQPVLEAQHVHHGADEGRGAVPSRPSTSSRLLLRSARTEAIVKLGWSPGTRRTASR